MLSHVFTNTPTHVLWGTLHHFQGLMKYFHWTAVPYITHTLQVTEKVCFKKRRWVVYWNWTGVYSSACKQARLLSTPSHRGLKPLTDTSQETRGSSFKANRFWGFWWCGKARKAWMEKSNTWDAGWNHILHAKVSWDCAMHTFIPMMDCRWRFLHIQTNNIFGEKRHYTYRESHLLQVAFLLEQFINILRNDLEWKKTERNARGAKPLTEMTYSGKELTGWLVKLLSTCIRFATYLNSLLYN